MIELSNGGHAQLLGVLVSRVSSPYTTAISVDSSTSSSLEMKHLCTHTSFIRSLKKCIEVLGRRNKHYLSRGTESKNIEDLTDAVTSYFIGTAIRSIQEEELGRAYQSSALIHRDIAQRLTNGRAN